MICHPQCRVNGSPLLRSLYAIFTPARIFYTAFLCVTAYIPISLIVTADRFVSGENTMDILYIALIIGFVALSIALIHFFETLRRPQ